MSELDDGQGGGGWRWPSWLPWGSSRSGVGEHAQAGQGASRPARSETLGAVKARSNATGRQTQALHAAGLLVVDRMDEHKPGLLMLAEALARAAQRRAQLQHLEAQMPRSGTFQLRVIEGGRGQEQDQEPEDAPQAGDTVDAQTAAKRPKLPEITLYLEPDSIKMPGEPDVVRIEGIPDTPLGRSFNNGTVSEVIHLDKRHCVAVFMGVFQGGTRAFMAQMAYRDCENATEFEEWAEQQLVAANKQEDIVQRLPTPAEIVNLPAPLTAVSLTRGEGGAWSLSGTAEKQPMNFVVGDIEFREGGAVIVTEEGSDARYSIASGELGDELRTTFEEAAVDLGREA